jgi:uncharacterized protein YneF (UPF0154 family)
MWWIGVVLVVSFIVGYFIARSEYPKNDNDGR